MAPRHHRQAPQSPRSAAAADDRDRAGSPTSVSSISLPATMPLASRRAIILGKIEIAHVTFGRCLLGNDVALGAAADDRPVERRAELFVAEIVQLQQLVCQLDDRIPPFLGRAAGVGGPALDVEKRVVDALRHDRHRRGVGLGERRLERQGVILLGRKLADELARPERSHLLVGVEQHRQLAIAVETQTVEQIDRVQDHGDTPLGVTDTGPGRASLRDGEGPLRRRPLAEHRVVMHHQHDVLVARAALGPDDRVAAELLRRPCVDGKTAGGEPFGQHGLEGRKVPRDSRFPNPC